MGIQHLEGLKGIGDSSRGIPSCNWRLGFVLFCFVWVFFFFWKENSAEIVLFVSLLALPTTTTKARILCLDSL